MLLSAVNFCKTFAHMSTFAKLLHAYQNFTWTLHLSTALQRRRFRWVYILNLQLTAMDKIGHIIQDGINERIIELLTKRIESIVSQFLQDY